MRGSIRTFVGLFIVFGAVGGMEDPSNSLLLCVALAAAGLGLMLSGVNAMKEIR